MSGIDWSKAPEGTTGAMLLKWKHANREYAQVAFLPADGTREFFSERESDWEYHENPAVLGDLDEINHPSHYQSLPGFESIDIIQSALTPEEFQGFCKGNMLKYRFRAGKKGSPETCIAKADWYEKRAQEAVGVKPSHAERVASLESFENKLRDMGYFIRD